jgi:hypothetical protein
MKTVTLYMEELPPTLNTIISAARTSKFLSAKLKKQWHKKIGLFVLPLERIEGKIYLECVWFVKNRNRDSDNIEAAQKYILDTLVEQNRIDEDNLSTIQSPKIHHFLIAAFDGFCIFIRDKEAFQERLKEDLSLPPILPSGNIQPKVRKRTRPTKVRSGRKSNRLSFRG